MKARLEEGSGTMAGAMLVMLAAVMLTIIAFVGNLMLCQHKARSIADLAAFNAAYALWHQGLDDPCAFAGGIAAANEAVLADCEVQGDDIRLAISIDTDVPFAPHVRKEARAGPVLCD